MDRATRHELAIVLVLLAVVCGTAGLVLGGAQQERCPARQEITPIEQEMLELINTYRMAEDQAPFATDPTLTRAAQLAASEFAQGGRWEHGDFTARNGRCGLTPHVDQGELLARGHILPAQALRGWQESPEHNRVLLSERYAHAGVARRWGLWTDQRQVPYWVLELSGSE